MFVECSLTWGNLGWVNLGPEKLKILLPGGAPPTWPTGKGSCTQPKNNKALIQQEVNPLLEK